MISDQQRAELRKRVVAMDEANKAVTEDLLSRRSAVMNAVRCEVTLTEVLRYIDVEL